MLRTKMIAGFQAIETLLVLQVEMNKFRHFVMVAVDLTGNCLLCDTDYILTRVKINHLPNSTQTIDFETRKRIQWHHSTYIFYETCPIGGVRTIEEKQHVVLWFYS